ncbi:MAG: hypothetical protein PHC34_04705 [Candidatus Gastranaerophilales bacterium]|nr:hypothetical protein [Candidatus Gastranaerophilales bacterium]
MVNEIKKLIDASKYKECFDKALGCSEFVNEIYNPVMEIEQSDAAYIYLTALANKFYSSKSQKSTKDKNFWYELGYKQVGLMQLGFTYWLIDMLKRDKAEKVFFLARDGYILKKIYDLVASSDKSLPPSQYLYASRRSMHIPSLADNDDEDVLKYMHCRLYGLKVSQFLEKIDFDPDKYATLIKQAGFKGKDDRIVTKEDFDNLSKFYNLIYDDLKNLARTEKENLIKYLKNAGIFDSNNFALVDIGWGASLQNSLSKVIRSFSNEANINGYYLGTFKTAQDVAAKDLGVSGYLFDFDKPEQIKNTVMQCVELFEFFHIAPHGSVVKFRESMEPVFDLDCNLEKIKKGMKVQQGVLDFIKDFQQIQKEFGEIKISKELAIKPISRILTNPTYQEAVLLGNLIHVDGHINTQRYIARPPNRIKSFLKTSSYEEEYVKCYWKLGYIKRWFHNKDTGSSQDLIKLNMIYYLKRNSIRKKVMEFIKANKNKKICFYGAGQFAQEFLKIYDLTGLNIIGFIDNNPDKRGQMIENYKIYSTNDLQKLMPDALVLMILDKEKILPFINNLLKENEYKFNFVADLIS